MKTLLLALLLASIAIGTATASDDLVDTAKEAKAKRKKSTTKVITNADVKKAKAKVAATSAPTAPVPTQPTLMEKHLAGRETARVHAERTAALSAVVADLEKEIVAIEQRYYEENDLNRRDNEIVKRFNETKARLDTARKELAALSSPPPG